MWTGRYFLPKQSLDLFSRNIHHIIEKKEKLMTIFIEDAGVETLVRQIALAEGVSVDEVLRESLMARAARRGLAVGKRPPLRERLATLAREVDAIPARTFADVRSDDEILGYGEHGVW